MKRHMSKRERLRRLEARVESIQERLNLPVPEPVPGQQSLPADLLHALHGPHHDIDESDQP